MHVLEKCYVIYKFVCDFVNKGHNLCVFLKIYALKAPIVIYFKNLSYVYI